MAPSKYITLVSAEGFEYVLPREACHASQMLRTSVDPDKHFKENRETVVNLPEMRLVISSCGHPGLRHRPPLPSASSPKSSFAAVSMMKHNCYVLTDRAANKRFWLIVNYT